MKGPFMMNATDYLLLGGGLASAQAAKHLRQHDATASITLVGEEPYVPYDRPPLSKEFLRGEKPRDQLSFEPESYFRDHRIDLILGTRVQHLHTAGKRVTLDDGRTIQFGKALLATGGRPIRLSIPGANLAGVHYFRTLDDAAAIAARAVPGVRAVLIGAGFIGMEVAASLTQRGVHTTVIESQAHIWPRFADAALAGAIQDYFAQKGVTIRTKDQVIEIHGQDRASSVILKSGDMLPCDLVVIGVGIAPNVELAKEAGLTVDNGIVVDEYLQSSHPDVYAAGDVAHYLDPIFKKRRRVEHWGHAEYCGQLAGQNMAGASNPYDLLTYVWSDLFDLHLEFAGDESEHDQLIVRSHIGDKSYIILYLKQHALTAYFAVNAAAKDLPPLQRAIKQHKDLSGKELQLQDPSIPLKSII
jgi:3-phenylpropionate/trans-cinnamate dioxygenase ferredoxin reductase component